MSISRQDIELHFSVNDIIASGGGRRFFQITEILDDRVRIQPTQSKTASRLRLDKLTVVVNNFHAIDPQRIEASVGELLSSNGLIDTQNESYLYGMAREYINRQNPTPAALIESEFEEAIEEAKRSSPAERKSRLDNASKKPRKVTTTSTAYLRNPYVVVEVLERAGGLCEGCNKKAPFLKAKDKTPYLEVHHIIQLAHGGYDTVDNAIALCPNCHREKHYGASA